MEMFKHNFTCIFLIYLLVKGFSVLGDDVQEVLICAPSFNDSSTKTLQCGDQQVIDIKRSIAGRYWKLQCNETEIISWFKNPYVDSHCKKDVILYHDCQGNKLCFIKDGDMTVWRLNSCDFSNVLYIQYVCHNFNRHSTLVMGKDKTATGKSIDLLSPNFPCRKVQQYHSTLCTIDPTNVQNGGDVVLTITVKFLDLRCGYSLYYKTRNSQQTERVQINCLNGNRQAYHVALGLPMDINSKWDIGYYNRILYGYKFWILITGSNNNNLVNITVSCTDQTSNINLPDNNEYDSGCDLFPVYSSSTTTTTPIAVTTAAMNGTSQYVTSAANVTAVPIGMVTKTERKLATKDILPSVLGGVLGLLAVVGLVAAIIICLMRRRREGHKDAESTCQGPASPAVNSIGVYAIAGPINEDPISDKQTNKKKNNYDNVAIVDKSVLYAVPDKKKKTKAEEVRKIHMEEGSQKINEITENKNGVVMSENELYEPCPNTEDYVDENLKYLVKYESLKSKNNEEETDNDYQIMYENNELYSSSVDLAEDGTELDPDVTYENVPNSINHDSD